MTLASAQVCGPCKDRKRRCDKLLPSCSLCQRQKRACYYGSNAKKHAIVPEEASHTVSKRVETPHRSLSPDPHHSETETTTFPVPDYVPIISADIHNTITAYLFDMIGPISEVRQMASIYFSSIHLWWPILSSDIFSSSLPSIYSSPNADISILSLSMALITAPVISHTNQPAPELHAVVKVSFAMLEAANINSLAVIQSRILLSLFEMAHGLNQAAYLSVGTTVRSAIALGIGSESEKRSDSELCAWWGAVMLDRFYALVHGSNPERLEEPVKLPVDESLQSEDLHEQRDISTPSSVYVGPFARQAQVSHLLSRLITHLNEPTNDKTFNDEERLYLTNTLGAFSRLLPEKSHRPWPRYCGVTGMCFSSLLMLDIHESNGTTSSHQLPINSSLLFTLESLSQISSFFNEALPTMDTSALSPFVPHSLYLAIGAYRNVVSHASSDTRVDVDACWRGLSSMERMLRSSAGRWGCAALYLRKLGLDPE